MTVRENLLLGAYTDRKAAARRLEEVMGDFPELSEKIGAYAGSLSGGQQQMMAIGRGLMSDPHYLLLDEPSLGLAPQVTRRIFDVIVRLRDAGKGILLVEQNGRLALEVAGHAFLLERGTITLTGTGRELLAHAEVVERYLGVGTAAAEATRQQDWTRALRRALTSSKPPATARRRLSQPLIILRTGETCGWPGSAPTAARIGSSVAPKAWNDSSESQTSNTWIWPPVSRAT
jgi:ABC-type multidrug transport system ATPase subunit